MRYTHTVITSLVHRQVEEFMTLGLQNIGMDMAAAIMIAGSA
ncbi:MAG: hypothetical protein K0S45_3281 [Nitrospira sp.]|nr:hypothetical protein [Nitrospira sp.]